MGDPAAKLVVAPVMLLHGFTDARRRYGSAARPPSVGPEPTFKPLFEALNWCVALDDRLQAWWKVNATNRDRRWCDGFRFGETVLGTRYARNRVHHQWADALWFSLSAPLRPGGPPRGPEWRWRPSTQLPDANKGHAWNRSQYDATLAGHPARDTLVHVQECFAEALSAGLGHPALG